MIRNGRWKKFILLQKDIEEQINYDFLIYDYIKVMTTKRFLQVNNIMN